MKKTLTVNLNNIVFHIDDDAYEILQKYLSDVEKHLSQDEKKEVMADIEARVAELFTERLQKNKNVINVEDVETIINILGKPSQYSDVEEAETTTESTKSNKKKSRRFYRDPENAMLGGIAGGIAALLGWDVTIIRGILVLLVIFGVGMIIPVYILVWLIAPAAVTVSQRLEMQGEDVTVENIKTEINNVKNYMESEKFKQSATSIGVRLGQIFGWFFKILFGFIGAILGLVGVIVVGALLLVLFFLLFEPAIFSGFAPDIVTNMGILTPENTILFIIALLLVVGCPIFMLIYWAIRAISGRRDHSHTASWVVLVLWLAGLFMFYSVGAKTFISLNRAHNNQFAITWSDDDLPLVDEVRNSEPFNAIDLSGNIELTLKQDSVQQVTVSSPDSYLSKVITEVDNGTLRIYSDNVLLNRKIKVFIASNSINKITVRGACEIETESQLTVPNLSLHLIGASKADMDLNISGVFDVDIAGASSSKFRGQAETISVKGLGASKVQAFDLIAKNANVDLAGASRVFVYATESINAKAVGASQIDCKGNPKNKEKYSTFGSSINIE